MNDMGRATASVSAPDTTIFSLLHAAHALENRLEEALDRVGVSSAKYAVLKELVAARTPLSLGDLANRLSCVKSNMTQLVDRLEADGLVRRVACPTDRRSVKAEITEAGRERQKAGAREVAKLDEDFAKAIKPSDRASLERVLSALG